MFLPVFSNLSMLSRTMYRVFVSLCVGLLTFFFALLLQHRVSTLLFDFISHFNVCASSCLFFLCFAFFFFLRFLHFVPSFIIIMFFFSLSSLVILHHTDVSHTALSFSFNDGLTIGYVLHLFFTSSVQLSIQVQLIPIIIIVIGVCKEI